MELSGCGTRRPRPASPRAAAGGSTLQERISPEIRGERCEFGFAIGFPDVSMAGASRACRCANVFKTSLRVCLLQSGWQGAESGRNAPDNGVYSRFRWSTLLGGFVMLKKSNALTELYVPTV